jgi:hypothetical protein
VITGPPGLGKTTMARKIATQFRRKWAPVSPRSVPGFIELLYANRHEGCVMVCDDFDDLWYDRASLNVLKSALDTQKDRWLQHDVIGRHKVKPFPCKCAMIFLSNIDFSDPTKFGKLYESHVLPVLSRGALMNLSFDPLHVYEYTGWIATEGQMLRRQYRDQQKQGEAKTHRFISLIESNEVLAVFREYAEYWHDGLTPRQLVKIAMARIGQDKAVWLADCHRLLMSPVKLRTLPHDLPLFQCTRPVKKTAPDGEG